MSGFVRLVGLRLTPMHIITFTYVANAPLTQIISYRSLLNFVVLRVLFQFFRWINFLQNNRFKYKRITPTKVKMWNINKELLFIFNFAFKYNLMFNGFLSLYLRHYMAFSLLVLIYYVCMFQPITVTKCTSNFSKEFCIQTTVSLRL